MTSKELKELAKACRQAGIKHYRNGDVEFTLSDEVPASKYKKSLTKSSNTKAVQELVADQIESDGWDNLSLDQKLMWSSDSLIPGEDGEMQS